MSRHRLTDLLHCQFWRGYSRMPNDDIAVSSVPCVHCHCDVVAESVTETILEGYQSPDCYLVRASCYLGTIDLGHLVVSGALISA